MRVFVYDDRTGEHDDVQLSFGAADYEVRKRVLLTVSNGIDQNLEIQMTPDQAREAARILIMRADGK